jgi:hypothetical protein
MGVDTKTQNPANGRASTRLTSTKAYNINTLFVADIAHMVHPSFSLSLSFSTRRYEIDVDSITARRNMRHLARLLDHSLHLNLAPTRRNRHNRRSKLSLHKPNLHPRIQQTRFLQRLLLRQHVRYQRSLGRLHAGRYRWLRRPRFATYFLWSGV